MIMLRKILPYSLFLAFLMSLSLPKAGYSQEITDMAVEKPDKIYWFYVTLEITRNKQTRMDEYDLRPSGGGIYSGDEESFKKQLWEQRSEMRLAIGPYWSRQQAMLAQRMYSQVSRGTRVQEISYDQSEQAHWYYLKVNVKRSGFKLEPTAARVATGSMQSFFYSLKEGLVQEMLAVGPFLDYNEAEDSKASYKAQEDMRVKR